MGIREKRAAKRSARKRTIFQRFKIFCGVKPKISVKPTDITAQKRELIQGFSNWQHHQAMKHNGNLMGLPLEKLQHFATLRKVKHHGNN